MLTSLKIALSVALVLAAASAAVAAPKHAVRHQTTVARQVPAGAYLSFARHPDFPQATACGPALLPDNPSSPAPAKDRDGTHLGVSGVSARVDAACSDELARRRTRRTARQTRRFLNGRVNSAGRRASLHENRSQPLAAADVRCEHRTSRGCCLAHNSSRG